MNEYQSHSQIATIEAPVVQRRHEVWRHPPLFVGVFAILVMITILAFGWRVIASIAGPFLWIVTVFLAAFILVVISLCIWYAISTFLHKKEMLRLEREQKQAEIDQVRLTSRLVVPTSEGNYAAFLHPDGYYVQANPGNVMQPVPHTYAPHITYHSQNQLREAEKQAETKVSEIDANFPTMHEIYSALHENALEVCLGRSKTSGELFIMPLLDGTHYRVIGGSGFGKSCFAGSILDMTTTTNDPDHLQVCLLDLEHKTSRLFENLPHIAQIQVGRRWIDCFADGPDEVAIHLGYLRKELDRRKALSEYDLQRERFMLIYVEEFLSLKREVDPKMLDQMADDFTILAARGRKYGMYLLACAQVDYADRQFRDAMNQFNVNASFSVKPRAAQAVGFMSYDLLKQNFAAKQRGQFVLETTGCTDIMLAPQYDVKKMLLQLERPSFADVHAPLLNEPRTVPERDENENERASALALEVMNLKSRNWGKQAIIEHVWGVKKGGSPRYKLAEEEYESIIAEEA